MTRIERTKNYLKQQYDMSDFLNSNTREKEYRYEHTLRVAKWGSRIARFENLDEEALVVGCLLHDVSYIEEMVDDTVRINHGRRSAALARTFVESLDFDEETTRSILYGIATHVDGKADFDGEATVLSESISDADNLDRFDVYRIYEGLEFQAFSVMPLDEKINYCNKRIENGKKLLNRDFSTDYATKVFHEEVSYMIQFFEKMEKQLSNIDD